MLKSEMRGLCHYSCEVYKKLAVSFTVFALGAVHILRSGFRGGRGSDEILQNTTGGGGGPGDLIRSRKNFQNFFNFLKNCCFS